MNKSLTNDNPRLKRLQYRSWHRGCKETDLILGRFSDEKLATLPANLLDIYERLLDENDADIWNWVVGKEAPAEYIELIVMFRKLMAAA